MDPGEHGASQESVSTPPPFVWPPRRPLQPPGIPIHPAPTHVAPAGLTIPDGSDKGEHGTSRQTWRKGLLEIERQWLGLIAPPWSIRAAEAGWAPDSPSAYCWRCGRTVGEFEVTPPESADPGCLECRSKKLPWDRLVRAGEYRSILRRAIQETKFRASHVLGYELGRTLGRSIEVQLRWANIPPASVLIVPAPMSRLRRFRTGIDHAAAIARGVAEVAGGRIIQPLARRHGPSQLEIPPSERSRNAARSIALRPASLWGWSGLRCAAWIDRATFGLVPRASRWARLLGAPPPEGWTLIVVDDVKTTGATMSAICRGVRMAIDQATPNDSAGGDAARGGRKKRSRVRIWSAVVAVTPERGGGPREEEIPEDSLVDEGI